ncbi:MAG: hypothetical protein Q7O66_08555, partial [Dehalococcoidia bacterium]|nr:hypothetical protein [Dehalococcoidia bacterium]
DNSTYILGRIKVSPMTSATSPSNRLDATFGGALNLKGYETAVEKPDTGIEGQRRLVLTLYWLVDSEVTKDYKVFVHLLDGAGKIVTQKDSDPEGGNYPTSYWQKGEDFSDQYDLSLRAEELDRIQSARVGLYDPVTGSRVILGNGADSLVIPLAGLAQQ